jgi:hypothetical protein
MVLLGTLLSLLGCSGSEDTPSPAEPTPTAVPAVGPRATVEQILTLRAERQYAALRAHIKPGDGGKLVATLIAIDDLLDANEVLQQWVLTNVGPSAARTIDQDYLSDALGIFSRNVELLDDALEGDVATVTYTVGGRLPAQVARLVRVGDAWCYDPEDGYSPALPEALHELAHGLERTRDELASGRWNRDELARNPNQIVRLIESNLRPGLRKLGEARAALERTAP